MQAARGSRPEAPRNLRAELREGLAFTWRQPFLRYASIFGAAVKLLFQVVVLGLIVRRQARRGLARANRPHRRLFGVGGLAGRARSPLVPAQDPGRIGGTAHDNAIGLAATSPPMINAISGNSGYGVELTGQSYDNQVLNSFIGTDVSGNAAIANALGGILVGGTSHNDTIGGANGTPSAPTADLVSGNTGNGITLGTGTSFIQVIGNSIGFDHSGNPVLPNSGTPIVNNGTSNTIQDNAIACFVAGTRIATEHGEVAVEALQIGDTVRTRVHGQMAPVIWIGHRQVDCRSELLKMCDPKLVIIGKWTSCWITAAGADPLKYFNEYPGRFPLVRVKDLKSLPKVTQGGSQNFGDTVDLTAVGSSAGNHQLLRVCRDGRCGDTSRRYLGRHGRPDGGTTRAPRRPAGVRINDGVVFDLRRRRFRP